MDSHFTGMWVSFFTAAGIPPDVAATYALTFTENRIQNDMLLDLNKEYLRDMGISRMGDVIAILRHAKSVHESTARERVLGSTVRVPVAAVAGRLSSKPTSPASRILEHYTRNTTPDSSPPRPAIKRKSNEAITEPVLDIKKTRLIRFGTSPAATTFTEEPTTKPKVFSRLGTAETNKVTPTNAGEKPIFSRLGAKSDITTQTTQIPIQKDALKYEGILKTPVVKKVMTVTASSNSKRKIAVGTMRADETPLSVKEKLALPISKAKSVKFSNTVEYKEIDRVTPPVKVVPKFTSLFNKPERRLSMPDAVDTPGVKARLGAKNANNLTITKNVFNRLGV